MSESSSGPKRAAESEGAVEVLLPVAVVGHSARSRSEAEDVGAMHDGRVVLQFVCALQIAVMRTCGRAAVERSQHLNRRRPAYWRKSSNPSDGIETAFH